MNREIILWGNQGALNTKLNVTRCGIEILIQMNKRLLWMPRNLCALLAIPQHEVKRKDSRN